MTEYELLDAVGRGESRDWEFKSARGGVPASLWETYSAMANTDGGTVVLGVGEKNGQCTVEGLDKVAQYTKNVFDTVNNLGKVSVNLLTDRQVQAADVGGKTVLVIQVPRAGRRQRPVFVGQNPLTGTYRRTYEGDYHCKPEEVGRMLADQAEEPADSRVLEHFGWDDVDQASLDQYRNRFSARAPGHPWLGLDKTTFLEKLGGWRKDRATGAQGLTVAGLLMFGKDEAIRAPEALPRYQVDYREKRSEDAQKRWDDRITVDGTWVANLYQFYHRAYARLTADLKTPFQLDPEGFRKDETPAHEAVREALVNALIHADYGGIGGVVIESYRDRIEMSNPGSLLISYEQLVQGGVSECRNRSLQLMFQMIGAGEKAGSGIDKIRQGWAAQHWRSPSVLETVDPVRVRLVLPMVSLLPEASLARLRGVLGADFDTLAPLEVQALVTADLEGEVSNRRMQLACEEHPSDLTKLLQHLVARGFLDQRGQKRATTYALPEAFFPITGSSPYNAPSSPHNAPSSPHNAPSSPHNAPSSPHNEPPQEAASPTTDPVLLEIAQPAREKPRLAPELTCTLIRQLCQDRFLTGAQIAELLERSKEKVQERFLTPMVARRELRSRFPDDPNHPSQAYTTNDIKLDP